MTIDQFAAAIMVVCNLKASYISHSKKDQCIDHFNNCAMSLKDPENIDPKKFDECVEKAKILSKDWE